MLRTGALHAARVAMNVGILVVTHGRLGHYFLETLGNMIGTLPLAAEVLEIRSVQDPEVLLRQGRRVIERLNQGAGVLILTDAYGSTPSNIATRLYEPGKTRVIAGINLPMLVRIFNYPKQPLEDMAKSAIEAGQRGILNCDH